MKKKTFNTSVTEDFNDERIDKFLQSLLKELSRTRIQNLIKDSRVWLNNVAITSPSKKIKNQDQIQIKFPEPKETLIKPNKISLDILYDDEDLIVINKSPGVVVHPGAGNTENTIVNGLMFLYKNNLLSVRFASAS